MQTETQTHEEVVQSLIVEAGEKLIEKVNQAHEATKRLASKFKEVIVESINSARATGLFLIELSDQTPSGKWEKLFRSKQNPDAPILFSDETARQYIKLASALPDPLTLATLPEGVRHLKDMLIIVEALPAPHGHGEQTRHEQRSPFQTLIKFACEIQGCLSSWRKEKPIEDWTPELKAQVKSQLEPLVKFYQSL